VAKAKAVSGRVERGSLLSNFHCQQKNTPAIAVSIWSLYPNTATDWREQHVSGAKWDSSAFIPVINGCDSYRPRL